ncbi:NAD-dependent epimerase/dehydratase family protein [Aquipuribacter sp. SD81]|uniref:NAD-dependent epimerase/dehydratase family protein n=1 Tax=Aquipuribacter sp. SD81 TaxID=3127703 RepID=UPI00301760D7
MSPTTTGTTAAEVVAADLDHICDGLAEELAELAGHRLLIVGGAGFLGHYLVQAAVHHNARGTTAPIDVTVLDNYSRGVPDWLRALEGRPNLTLSRFDITAPLPDDLGHYDYVVHAASIASPTYYRLHPIETMDANVNGLRSLLDYAVAQERAGSPLKGFLFYSTSEIYGDPTPDMIPTPETYRGNVSCTGPRACYDESKRYGETLCVNFAQQHGVPVTVARPFNNYGPGLKITDGRVLSDFCGDVLAGRDIVMLSDGSPTRTFCYVADAVIGYYKILVRGRPGEAYNIGTETPEISMAELAERVVAVARDEIGYTGSVVRRTSADADYLVDNPNRRCPVIAKAREELGYEPTVTIDEGLRRALVWYRDNRTAEES